MYNTNRAEFAKMLCKLYENFDEVDFDDEAYSSQVMASFAQFGSKTPSNQHCYENIEYSKAVSRSNPDVLSYGFKLKGKEVFVGHVINAVEGMELPREIAEEFPSLTNEDWEAIMRMATMIIQAFSPFKPVE